MTLRLLGAALTAAAVAGLACAQSEILDPVEPAGAGGTTGEAGNPGTSGESGAAGSTGAAGRIATAGTSGAAGTFGAAGTTGSRGGTTGLGGSTGGRGGTTGAGGSSAGRGGTTGTGRGGTTGAGTGGTGPAATFTQVYNMVIVPNCSGAMCHNPGAERGVSFATKGSAYSYATRSGQIDRNSPMNSFIYFVMSTTPQFMPPAPNAKVPTDQLALVSSWISAGYPNN